MKLISIIMSLQKLHSRLYILRKSTEDLVSQYLSDLAQLQPRDDDEGGGGRGGEETFGTLHFSVAYLKDRSTLEIDVMQAVNLPALDRDGMLLMHDYCQAHQAFYYTWYICCTYI
jgi:hypothetical protein